jgi:hypothetical protein
MTDENSGFRLPRIGKPYEKYFDTYVIINLSGKPDISGKVVDSNGNFLTLNPFQDGKYNSKGKWETFLQENPIGYDIPMNAIQGVKPTTKKDLEDLFNGSNKNNALQSTGKESNKIKSFLRKFLRL